jgi:hypothetical protein
MEHTGIVCEVLDWVIWLMVGISRGFSFAHGNEMSVT